MSKRKDWMVWWLPHVLCGASGEKEKDYFGRDKIGSCIVFTSDVKFFFIFILILSSFFLWELNFLRQAFMILMLFVHEYKL